MADWQYFLSTPRWYMSIGSSYQAWHDQVTASNAISSLEGNQRLFFQSQYNYWVSQGNKDEFPTVNHGEFAVRSFSTAANIFAELAVESDWQEKRDIGVLHVERYGKKKFNFEVYTPEWVTEPDGTRVLASRHKNIRYYLDRYSGQSVRDYVDTLEEKEDFDAIRGEQVMLKDWVPVMASNTAWDWQMMYYILRLAYVGDSEVLKPVVHPDMMWSRWEDMKKSEKTLTRVFPQLDPPY